MVVGIREHCCDDVVVSITGNAHEYALALAALEQNRLSGREPAIAATGGHLTKRIHRLLHPGRAIGSWLPLLAVGVFLVTAAVSLAALPRKSLQNASTDVQTQPATAPASSYSKWLDEDVVYIIEDPERAAFLKLATNDEREHFIQQFWERRRAPKCFLKKSITVGSPSPICIFKPRQAHPAGGPTAATCTSSTVRPIQIEAHPKGSPKPFATEVWFYSHIAGLGDNTSLTFIDTSGRGDFHLAPGSALTPDHPRQDPLSKDATIPECLYCPTPQYTDQARWANLQGNVVLRATIMPDGHAVDISVLDSLGLGLDEKAVEALRTWKFKPAYDKSGQAAPKTVPIQITFRLHPDNTSEAQPTTKSAAPSTAKFVLGDFKIDGEVHDRDGVRDRVLAGAKGVEKDNPQDLTSEVAEVEIRGDFQDRGYFKVVVHDPTWDALGVKDGKQRIRITAPITEGPQFRVGSFTFQSNSHETLANFPEETTSCAISPEHW